MGDSRQLLTLAEKEVDKCGCELWVWFLTTGFMENFIQSLKWRVCLGFYHYVCISSLRLQYTARLRSTLWP
jgi:hypothetical protein